MASAVSATETRVKTSVQSVDELSGVGFGQNTSQGVDDVPMDNGDLAFVKEPSALEGRYYHLNKESAVPPSASVLLTTSARLTSGAIDDATAGPGRWVLGPDAESTASPTKICYVPLLEDAQTIDTDWTDLLVCNSIVATSVAQLLLIAATFSGSLDGVVVPDFYGQVQFRIVVDNISGAPGTEQAAALTFPPSVVTPVRPTVVGAITEVVPVGNQLGVVVVRLQWKVFETPNQAQIWPVTSPDTDHASLVVQLLG